MIYIESLFFFFSPFLKNKLDNIIKPSDDTKKCPHESNGPNWIPFENSCYTFLLRAARWQGHDKDNEQQTCQRLGMGHTERIFTFPKLPSH